MDATILERKRKRKQGAKPGTCRKCGCTEDRACDGGCGWADDQRTLCTRCAEDEDGESQAVAYRKLDVPFDGAPCSAAVLLAQDKRGQWYGSSWLKWDGEVPWPPLAHAMIPSLADKFAHWKGAAAEQVKRITGYLSKCRTSAPGPDQLRIAAEAALDVLAFGEAVETLPRLPDVPVFEKTQPADESPPAAASSRPATRSAELEIPIEKIHRRPSNRGGVPVDPSSVEELAAQIARFGLSTAIEVRAASEEQELPLGHYEVLKGERRWVAHQVLGRETIRAVVVECDPAAAAAAVAIDNTHRADLDPIARARGIKEAQTRGLSVEDAGLAYGLGASAAKNALRLLELPPPVQAAVASRQLDQAVALAAVPLIVVPGIAEELERAAKRGEWWLENAADARGQLERNLLPKLAVEIRKTEPKWYERDRVLQIDTKKLSDAEKAALGMVEIRTGNKPKLLATNLEEVRRRQEAAKQAAEEQEQQQRKAAKAAGQPANPEAEKQQDASLQRNTEELCYLWLRLLIAEALQPGDPRTLRVIWWVHNARNRYGAEIPLAAFLDGALAILGRKPRRKGYRDLGGWEMAGAAIGADDWVSDHELTETLLAQLILWPVYRPARAPEDFDGSALYATELSAPHTLPETYCDLPREEICAAAEWLAKAAGPSVHGEKWPTTLADGWRAASERATSPHRLLLERWLQAHNGRQLERLCRELKIDIDPNAKVADRRQEIVSRHSERRLPLPKAIAKVGRTKGA